MLYDMNGRNGAASKANFTHPGQLLSIINHSNSIEEEIKERITLGIKAYYANQADWLPSIRN